MAQRKGLFVAVVGPSGAGKDSILNAVRARLGEPNPIDFARRVISRPAEPFEDHEPVSREAFDHLRGAGALVLTWEAHGLGYGLRRQTLDAVQTGRTVIANLSRGAVPEATAVFGHCRTICVLARPEILAQRIAGRGREDIGAQEQRIARQPPSGSPDRYDVSIDNSGALEDSVQVFLAALKGFGGLPC